MSKRYDLLPLMAALLYLGAVLGTGSAGAADEPPAQAAKPEMVQLLFVQNAHDEFLPLWTEGQDSFLKDPPTARCRSSRRASPTWWTWS